MIASSSDASHLVTGQGEYREQHGRSCDLSSSPEVVLPLSLASTHAAKSEDTADARSRMVGFNSRVAVLRVPVRTYVQDERLRCANGLAAITGETTRQQVG